VAVKPSCSKVCNSLGDLRASTAALWIMFAMFGGVPAGANRPYQLEYS